jgi:EpsI family protein
MTKSLVAFAFLAVNFYVYYFFATEAVIPPRVEFSEFPLQLGEWKCRQPEKIGARIVEILSVSDYLSCTFVREGSDAAIGVYVGYHASQVRKKGGLFAETVIHPPEHCLPGSGWDIIDSRIVSLDLPGLPGGHGLLAEGPEGKRFIIARGNARQLVHFWYQTQGRVIARHEDVILSRFWNRATRNRTDGALVRFTVNVGREDVATAEATFREFAEQFVPRLTGYIPL